MSYYLTISLSSLIMCVSLTMYTTPSLIRKIHNEERYNSDLLKATFCILSINRLCYALAAIVLPHEPHQAGYKTRLILALFSIVCGCLTWVVIKFYERLDNKPRT